MANSMPDSVADPQASKFRRWLAHICQSFVKAKVYEGAVGAINERSRLSMVALDGRSARRVERFLAEPGQAAALGWSLLVAAPAWIVLATLPSGGLPMALCSGGALGGLEFRLSTGFAQADPLRLAGEWALMFTAMMAPLAAHGANQLVARNRGAHLTSAMLIFLSSYTLPWAAAAILGTFGLILGEALLGALGVSAIGGLIGCGVAAVLELVARRRSPSGGYRAGRATASRTNLEVARFGFCYGRRCVATCWAPMMLPMLGGHSLGVLAGVTILMWVRQLRVARNRIASAAVLVLLGIGTLT